MSVRTVRISFSEVVRCARIVYSENSEFVKELESATLKEKPIVFRPRGRILQFNSVQVNKVESKHPNAKLVNGWYIDTHMRIYYQDELARLVRTSPIDAIDGTFVTTKNGSVYQLGKMDVRVQMRLDRGHINSDDPLHSENIPFLVNASYDTHPQLE
jgi:hypothetical protein